ncbi:porin [Thermocrinis sp.]|uniref:porin n=1 Tax=Thermocrinis sp. TaxID=2024383 RepID=UPI003C00590E
MKKSLLAMAALMGVATLPAHAWRVNIDKDTFADITFGAQILGTQQGSRTSGANRSTDHRATNFSAKLVTIAASGQVNKLVYFNINAEALSPGFRQSFIVRDAFIGMRFANEFRVQAGAMRVPFSRIALTSSYNYLIPTVGRTDEFLGLPINPTDALGMRIDGRNDRNRDAGIVVWGNVAGGMLKYYLGVTDGRYDGRREGLFGRNGKDNLAYTIRLQFTPTMLGFKPETGYSLSDTYLGRRNVHNVGVGYRVLKAETTGRTNNYSKTAKLFTVDMIYEQKFRNLVPNLQVGYIDAKDVAYRYSAPNVQYGKATQIYAQGQLLYDQVVGFGRPALAIRFEQNKNKDLLQLDTNTVGATPTPVRNVFNQPIGEPKNTRVGVFVNYYIKGQDARISFGVDSVSRNNDSRNADPNAAAGPPAVRGRNFTDFTLYLQTRF